nr:P-loop NTPase fold protein [Vibrio brasiliensis]
MISVGYRDYSSVGVSVINAKNAIYNSWFNDFNWNSCQLGNKEYGEYLSSYLRSQDSFLVLNLNGKWGTGKTHFLKQLYTDLLYTHSYPCVYIDAWKSDFSDDPLLVIISEFLEQLNTIHSGYSGVSESLLANLGALAKKTWNVGVDIGAASIVNSMEGVDPSSVIAIASNLKTSGAQPQLGKALSDGYKKQLIAIKNTNESLKAYAETLPETNRKVFVLVDELDRCRPTYAIETLETIKHFFDIPDFVFVIATDTSQLSHSIKAVYGDRFDGYEYLSRFFNRTAELRQPNTFRFIESQLKQYKCLGLPIAQAITDSNLFPKLSNLGAVNEVTLSMLVADVITMYQLSLRKAEQLIAKFVSVLSYNLSAAPDCVFDYLGLLIMLAEKEISKYATVYESRQYKIGTFGTFDITSNELNEGVIARTSSYCWFTYLKSRNTLKVLDANLVFASNAFVSTYQFEKNKTKINQLRELLTKFEHTKQYRQSSNEQVVNYIQNNYIRYIDVTDSKTTVWNLDDYYSAVSLAGTLS